MDSKSVKFGINAQILIVAVVGIILTGFLTYMGEYVMSDRNVREQVTLQAKRVSEDVNSCVKEYPAYHYLIKYWYENRDELDIEYDVNFTTGVETSEKVRLLTEHLGSDFNIRYATQEELENLSDEDMKLYAEIAYSWLITRINAIKKIYDIDYLFCVITDSEDGQNPFQTQVFLFSAGSEENVRGKNYEDIYVLGTTVSVADNMSQQKVMRDAVDNQSHTEELYGNSRNYIDYYGFMDRLDDKVVLVGITYDLTDLMNSIYSRAVASTLTSEFFQLVLIFFVMLVVFFYVVRPLKTVTNAIGIYKENKSSEEVRNRLDKNLSGTCSLFVRRNEIGKLSSDIAELANEMDAHVNRIQQISAENEHINTELKIASDIQMGMLPHNFPAFPDRKEFDLYASMNPAKEVGGDFYDFFLADDDHLVLVIADVSGKGIPAALFMMASKIVIHNMALQELRPSRILELVNKEICKSNPLEMFVTVWLGVLEISTGKLVASNAGHEIPAVKNGSGDFCLYTDPHGLVIGAFDKSQYTDYEINLEPGSKIFLYTDGVAEANDTSQQLYGTKRLINVLSANKEKVPKELLKSVEDDVNVFTNGEQQFDDLTMLCMEYHGKLY